MQQDVTTNEHDRLTTALTTKSWKPREEEAAAAVATPTSLRRVRKDNRKWEWLFVLKLMSY